MTSSLKCERCGFWLWQPIARTAHVSAGLYDDHRFPGRCLLVWHEHVEHLDELSADEGLAFLTAIQELMVAIKGATGSARVNVAVLGNQEPHLHAHLIPRGMPQDLVPDQPPWRHPEPARALSPDRREELRVGIGRWLAGDGWSADFNDP